MEKSAPVGRFQCGDACLHLPGLSLEARNRAGLQVQLRPSVEAGERIRVDTRDGHFVERAK